MAFEGFLHASNALKEVTTHGLARPFRRSRTQFLTCSHACVLTGVQLHRSYIRAREGPAVIRSRSGGRVSPRRARARAQARCIRTPGSLARQSSKVLSVAYPRVGHRYATGAGVGQSCEASVVYLEQAAEAAKASIDEHRYHQAALSP